MKSRLLALTVAVLFVVPFIMCQQAQAANPQTINVKVTILKVLSVGLSASELDFGVVSTGSATQSASGIVITNDGNGSPETLALSLVNPANWTAVDTASDIGKDKYMLCAAFDADGEDISWDSDKHAVKAGVPTAASSSKFVGNDEDYTGANIADEVSRKLHLKFYAPTKTATTTQQAISVMVTAQ